MSGFAPKEEVKLAPPKDDPITKEELAKCDGEDASKPIYVAIKGVSQIMAESTIESASTESFTVVQGPSSTSAGRRKCMAQEPAIM